MPTMNPRPLIGMPCALMRRGDTLSPVYGAIPAYVHAIEAAGGIPVLLPLWEQPESLAGLRGRVDGLLLMGGGDIDPAYFGEQAIPETQPPEATRDRVELELARQALDDEFPLLGICRGLQLLNVALDGTLVQDIAVQLPDAINHEMCVGGHDELRHPIEIEPDSRFAAIVGATHHSVNSYHHQAIGRLGRNIRAVARTADGLIEAIELPGQPFALAVQFHPERMVQDDPAMRHLFAAFVAACRVRVGAEAAISSAQPQLP